MRVPIVSAGPLPHTSMYPLSLLSVSPLLHPIITFCASLGEPNPSFARLPIPQMFRESHVISLLRWAGQRTDRLDRFLRSRLVQPDSLGVGFFFTDKLQHRPPGRLGIQKAFIRDASYISVARLSRIGKPLLLCLSTNMTPVYPQAVRVYLSLERECLDKR